MMDNIIEIKELRQGSNNEEIANKMISDGWKILNVIQETGHSDNAPGFYSDVIYVMGKESD